MTTTVTRPGDMHPMAALNIHRQDDGDIVIWVGRPYFPVGDGEYSVEFTTPNIGGGRSPYTYKALIALIEAIKKDNQNSPIYTSGEGGKKVQISKTAIEEVRF